MKLMSRVFLPVGLLLAWGGHSFLQQTGTIAPSRPNAVAVRGSSFGCTMTIGPIYLLVSSGPPARIRRSKKRYTHRP